MHVFVFVCVVCIEWSQNRCLFGCFCIYMHVIHMHAHTQHRSQTQMQIQNSMFCGLYSLSIHTKIICYMLAYKRKKQVSRCLQLLPKHAHVCMHAVTRRHMHTSTMVDIYFTRIHNHTRTYSHIYIKIHIHACIEQRR